MSLPLEKPKLRIPGKQALELSRKNAGKFFGFPFQISYMTGSASVGTRPEKPKAAKAVFRTAEYPAFPGGFFLQSTTYAL